MRARLFVSLGLIVTGTACAARQPATGSPSVAATSLATAPDQFFTSADARIRYREAGRGEPVVFIHGYSRSLDDWFAGLADSLALDHRVIALDVRGFGQSTRFTDPASLGRRMADDVVRLLDHLRVQRAHLAGHSMGALIAADVAVRHPARVRNVALIAGPFYPDSVAFARETARWVSELEAGRGLVAFLEWLFPGIPAAVATDMSGQTLAANPLPTLTATMRSLSALAVSGGGANPTPALIAAGTQDPLMPQSRWLAGRWRGSRLLELEGADHQSVVTRPELLAAIRALLRQRTSSARPATLRAAA